MNSASRHALIAYLGLKQKQEGVKGKEAMIFDSTKKAYECAYSLLGSSAKDSKSQTHDSDSENTKMQAYLDLYLTQIIENSHIEKKAKEGLVIDFLTKKHKISLAMIQSEALLEQVIALLSNFAAKQKSRKIMILKKK